MGNISSCKNKQRKLQIILYLKCQETAPFSSFFFFFSFSLKKAEQSIPSSFLIFFFLNHRLYPILVLLPSLQALFPGLSPRQSGAPRTSSGSLSGSSCLGTATGSFLTTEWYKKCSHTLQNWKCTVSFQFIKFSWSKLWVKNHQH